MSEDGNVFYFTTISPLNREASGEGFYRYDLDTGTLTFIPDFGGPKGTHGGPWASLAAATPNGYYWQNDVPDEAEPTEGLEQAYAYDAAEQMVLCVSCGTPFNPHSHIPSLYPTGETGVELDGEQSPLVSPGSANGNFVFFDTPSALLPNDINGELEPDSWCLLYVL